MRKIEDEALFQVKGGFHLTSGDQEVLSLLYLPVLRPEAFSLYFLLLSVSQNYDETNGYCQRHDVLTKKLSINETSLLKALEQLEALSLLKTYRREGVREGVTTVDYIYRVLPPLSGKAFLADARLRALLSQETGDEKEMTNLERKFSTVDDKFIGFAEISAAFDDVYQVEEEGNVITNNLDSTPKYAFDSDLFKKKLKEKGVKLSTIRENFDEIVSSANIYQIDEETAAELVVQNMDTSKTTFYIAPFQDSLKKYNSYIAAPREKKSRKNEITNQKLKVMNELSPVEFVSIRMNTKATGIVVKEIQKLRDEYSLPNPLINICIDYSLSMTQNKFNTAYIEKVALSLNANEITTIEEAAQYLAKSERSASKAKAKKSGGIKKERLETDVDDDVLEDSGL